MTVSSEYFAQTPDLSDSLSDVLTAVRFTGGHLSLHKAAPLTSVAFDAGQRSLLIVRTGTLRLRCDAGEDEIELGEGDIVLLPFASGFSLAASAQPARANTAHASAAWLRGTFHLDPHFAERLLSCLPHVMVLRQVDHGAMDWLETASRFALSEIQTPEPGAAVMVSRILELLLIRVLRLWAKEPKAQASWLLGAADPAIGRALSAMHLAPAQPWSVAELAKVAGLSRTVFASRFLTLVGQPPLRYLIGLRLDKAAELLKRTRQSLWEVAEATGYTSDAAFSRAFRARFGQSPAQWRKNPLLGQA